MPEFHPKCGNCLYCGKTDIDSNLQRQLVCIRFPPQMTPVQTANGPGMQIMQPPVREDMTCGEWRPNEELQADKNA